jgi:integrase
MAGSGGSVRQRANGSWEGRFWQDGRLRSVYAKTKADAQAKLRAALVGADAGVRQPSAKLTVDDWLDAWLAGGTWRPRTRESYEDTVERYIRPHLGRMSLAKLDADDVRRMLASLARRKPALSPTTQRYAYSVLRIALGRAVKEGKVLRNVAVLVDAPTKARRELTPLTAEQARAFLAASAGERFGPLYACAIATGLRQGELLALRWADVDVDAGTLTVRGTLQRGTATVAEPKTAGSRRTLALSNVALGALREQRRRQLEERLAAGRRWRDGGFVFTTGAGAPLDSRNVTQSLQVSLAKAGLPRQRFHDLRHAYATLLLAAGEELATLSKSLGHSNLSTTADVYAHFTKSMAERTAARVDAVLAAG